ncbi:MAG: flagellar hook-basal body complex protein [Pseudomonadota bacterium]
MENPIYIVLSRQTAMQRNLNIVSNNIANASTPGYQGHGAMFRTYLNRTDASYRLFGDPNMASAQDIGMYRDTKEGAFRPTGNALDFAIRGDGYFKILHPVVGERYTRAGNFTTNQEGQLVTAQGYQVLGAGSQPIFIPPDATDLKVSPDGTITAQILGPDGTAGISDAAALTNLPIVVGQIQAFRFQNPQDLKPFEDNLLSVEPGAVDQVADDVEILQNVIEGSNVQPIVELVKMISTTRGFTGGQSFIEGEHDRMRRMIQVMGRSN